MADATLTVKITVTANGGRISARLVAEALARQVLRLAAKDDHIIGCDSTIEVKD